MDLSKNQLKKVLTPLVGFSRNSIKVEGEITLLGLNLDKVSSTFLSLLFSFPLYTISSSDI